MRKSIWVLCLFLPALLLLAGQETVFEKAFSMEGISRVSVENVNGRIEAIAWDRPYLKVRAVKKASGRRAEESLRSTEIRIRKSGDKIQLETVSPRRRRLFGFLHFGHHNVRVDYEIHLPGSAEGHFETCNGQIHANGFTASVSADNVNGSIELKDMDGPVKASTVNGSVRVGFRGPLKSTELETVNGSVEVAFDRSSSVRYDLETVNGKIEGDIDLDVEGRHGPKEARGTYNGGAERLRCETINGSIRLKTN